MRMPRASKKRRLKAEAAAIARAKEAQHLRLVETLQGLNEKLRQEYAELATENAKHKADLSVAAQIFAAKSKDIETFKLEALQLTTELAEMRGYVARTLEDDAVREADIAVVGQADSVVTTTTQNMPRAMDNTARRYGPSALRGVPANYDVAPSRHNPLGQGRHWLNR